MDQESSRQLSEVNTELARRVEAMAAALANRGITIKVSSGFRSVERQRQLYANRRSNPYPVAVPGTSKHERGLAVDVVPVGARTAAVWRAIGEEAKRAGLRWGGDFARPDPVHVELASASGNVPSSGGVPHVPQHDFVLDLPNTMLLSGVAVGLLWWMTSSH